MENKLTGLQIWQILFLAGCGIVSYFSILHASADQLVQFESAVAKPTPFRVRAEQQQGKVPKAPPGTPLHGYLTRPDGEGPFPAIVVLHGCAGIGPGEKEAWPKRLSSWGFVVLTVDSFTTRDIQDTCDRLFVDRVYDAYGALDFLSKYSFVDSERIALMGFSAGGIATLQAVQFGAAEALMENKFKAAIAYYPVCSVTSGHMAVPTMILIGELDDWTPAADCRKMMQQRSGKGSPVQLVVYEGAHHGFDAENLKEGISAFGHWIQYNAVAADQSIRDSHVFLKRVFSN